MPLIRRVERLFSSDLEEPRDNKMTTIPRKISSSYTKAGTLADQGAMESQGEGGSPEERASPSWTGEKGNKITPRSEKNRRVLQAEKESPDIKFP